MAVNLEQFRNQVTQTPCVFGRFVVTLQGDDLDSVQAALLEPTITHRGIYTWARGKGYNGSESSAQKHRKGQCLCAL